MRQQEAEALAAEALAWMAEAPERLGGFLAATGIGPGDLRDAAGAPDVLAAVLDHLLGQEDELIACAAALGRTPERLVEARAALPGGATPHWT